MTRDDFWALVEKVQASSNGDFDSKCELLKTELLQRPLEDVSAFAAYFDTFNVQAYTWPLWGAAYVINGGCSDDGFMDFRAELISMGRSVFERALADPESLADLVGPIGQEGYQYVPRQVWRARADGELPDSGVKHPSKPAGKAWTEDDLLSLYPRLCAKYEF